MARGLTGCGLCLMCFAVFGLRSFAGYLGAALVFVCGGLLRGALISVFQGGFAGFGGVVAFGGGGWVLGCRCVGLGCRSVGLCGLETFLIFPNFLRSEDLSCLATRQGNSIYHVYK